MFALSTVFAIVVSLVEEFASGFRGRLVDDDIESVDDVPLIESAALENVLALFDKRINTAIQIRIL